MFLFQLLVTLISAIVHGIIMYYYQDDLGYINEGNNVLSNIVATWGSWFISFSNFIPISLLVTVEIVRFGQGLLLAKDPLCMCNNKQT